MNAWQAALAVGAIMTAILVRDDRRALGWIALAALVFVASTAWQRAGLPYHAAATGLMDAGQCLAIYFLARHTWELLLWRVWQLSLLISIFDLAGAIPGEATYVAALEACNWLALILIGGTAVARRVDDMDPNRRPVGGLRGAVRALRAPRVAPSWWHC